MKDEDVKIGMKVVPHSKAVSLSLETSLIWKYAKNKGQLYLYVYAKHSNYVYSLSYEPIPDGVDLFVASDFEPYEKSLPVELFYKALHDNLFD